MKITQVRAIPLTAPVPRAQKTSQGAFTELSIVVVEVMTDSGLVGYGESLARFAPTAYARLIEELLRPHLLGADPFNAEALWRRLFRLLSGRAGGMLIEAIAGVDIALWDVMGKATGLPLYKLIGGIGRETVAAYASSIMVLNEEETVAAARRLVDGGFRFIKLKLSGDARKDLATVRLVRGAIGPEVRLAVDANWAFDLDSATWLGQALAEEDVYWFEEPLPPEDVEGYRRLRERVPIRLAAGESEFTAWGARELITERLVGVIQPDVARAGGITETRRIAHLADMHHVRFAPHVGFSGAICVAAGLHLAAAMPNFLAYECMVLPNPLRENLTLEPVGSAAQLQAGMLPVPQEPGLGIDIDLETLERYRVRA